MAHTVKACAPIRGIITKKYQTKRETSPSARAKVPSLMARKAGMLRNVRSPNLLAFLCTYNQSHWPAVITASCAITAAIENQKLCCVHATRKIIADRGHTGEFFGTLAVASLGAADERPRRPE
jgi:hypothetical protein